MFVVPDFSGVAGWFVLAHRTCGRWDLLQWAIWWDAWRDHVEGGFMAGKIDSSLASRLLAMGWKECPRF